MAGLTVHERNWAALAHASGGIAMFFAPSFGFLAPLVLWALHKDKDAAIAWHAKQALYFQLAMTLLTWLCGVAGTALSCFLVGFVFYFVAIVPWLAGVVVPLLAATAVNNGRDDYAYPMTGGMVGRPPRLG